MSEQINPALIKAFAFGLTLPFLAIPLGRHLPDWAAWAIVATLETLLFHWLPPRIHVGLTPAKSVALSLAAGAAAAGAVLAVNLISR